MATALITGSYGGLGSCFVKLHASAGGDLILVGRGQKKLDEQKAQVEKEYGVKVNTIEADLSKAEDVEKVYNTCKQNGWTVDYLINNAGFGKAVDSLQPSAPGAQIIAGEILNGNPNAKKLKAFADKY